MKWSGEEIELLVKHYSNGTELLVQILKRNSKSITKKANSIGLFISNDTKIKNSTLNGKNKRGKKENYRVGDLTLNVDNYVSYVFGILWTDGFILKNRNTIGITIVKDDMLDIEWIFKKTGNWYIQDRKRKGRRESRTLTSYSPLFMDKLIGYGYDKKSYISPEKIFNIIPNSNIKYFFRGIIDGDGCFYVNKKNYTYQFSIASTYDQDWQFYINFFNKMNIKASVVRRIQKSGKSSIIRICGRNQISRLIEWLYEGYEYDKIGFTRKYEKSLLFQK